ncbi:MAG: hypothetical protein AB4368_13170 [Xenococcaceae cyanobacterium]
MATRSTDRYTWHFALFSAIDFQSYWDYMATRSTDRSSSLQESLKN